MKNDHCKKFFDLVTKIVKKGGPFKFCKMIEFEEIQNLDLDQGYNIRGHAKFMNPSWFVKVLWRGSYDSFNHVKVTSIDVLKFINRLPTLVDMETTVEWKKDVYACLANMGDYGFFLEDLSPFYWIFNHIDIVNAVNNWHTQRFKKYLNETNKEAK